MPLIQGAIVMWSGALQDIPDGWALCDGQNGTLDLRGKFIIGAGDLYAVNATGGSADAVLVSHTHTQTFDTVASHSHTVESNPSSQGGSFFRARGTRGTGGSLNYQDETLASGSHSHTVSVTSAGNSDGVGANLPPYYALAFIQQIAE